MKIINDRKMLAIVGLAVTLIVLVVILLLPKGVDEIVEGISIQPQDESMPIDDGEREVEKIVMKVDVKGAVNHPGVYVADQDDRVLDLIEKAGSFAEKADKNSVNLAQRVEDQMLIYVPLIGEEATSAILQLGQKTESSTGENSKVNINSADETEMQTLTGIGPSKAASIIQYRTDNGPFTSIEALKEISGIGDLTFEKIKEQITI